MSKDFFYAVSVLGVPLWATQLSPGYQFHYMGCSYVRGYDPWGRPAWRLTSEPKPVPVPDRANWHWVRPKDWKTATISVKGGSPPVQHLPADSAARKNQPMATGLLDYFPDALADVARLSKIGNDKHNAGQPLHWSREKSSDHADCIMRHMVDRSLLDDDGMLHDAKVAWRALAQLQLAIEARRKNGDTYPPTGAR